ncbi:hypothetical protein JNK13_05105 [bacterium]|nr:hypothetical protein [bacterium]
MQKLIFLLFCSLFLISCSSSSEVPQPADGKHCLTNEDCKAGNRCSRGLCEDIYHPGL